MKGRITEYKPAESKGTIAAFDTARYGFSRADWQSAGEPAAGLDVEFGIEGGSARDVALRQAGASQRQRSTSSTPVMGGAATRQQSHCAEPESTWAVISSDTNFGEAVSTCFRKSLTFSGRARRAEFWYFALFVFILNIILVIVLALAGVPISNWHSAQTTLQLAFLLPSLAVLVRRLHDRGHSGYWAWAEYAPAFAGFALDLIGYVPGALNHSKYILVGFSVAELIWVGVLIWIVAQTVMAGTFGPNRYGPDPLSSPDKTS